MFFINVQGELDSPHVRGKILKNAWRFMTMYAVPHKNKPLDNFLKTKYGVGIKACSMALLNAINITRDFAGNVIITFKDTSAENMAKLITYGTGVVSGSDILKLAFTIS